jgi:diadenosine tetraphosphate (Ap4A) HIT family hydrolase
LGIAKYVDIAFTKYIRPRVYNIGEHVNTATHVHVHLYNSENIVENESTEEIWV